MVTASDGIEALIRIRERRPDVVVSDVVMPRMDGFTLVKRIRQLPGLGLVPILMLSALDFEDMPLRSLRSGADRTPGPPRAPA